MCSCKWRRHQIANAQHCGITLHCRRAGVDKVRERVGEVQCRTDARQMRQGARRLQQAPSRLALSRHSHGRREFLACGIDNRPVLVQRMGREGSRPVRARGETRRDMAAEAGAEKRCHGLVAGKGIVLETVNHTATRHYDLGQRYPPLPAQPPGICRLPDSSVGSATNELRTGASPRVQPGCKLFDALRSSSNQLSKTPIAVTQS